MQRASSAVLGVDGGSTKTHLALSSPDGRLLAFVAGPSTSHEGWGYPHCAAVLDGMFRRALKMAGLRASQVRASCLGMCGGDLPEDYVEIEKRMVRPLGIRGPVTVRNDAFLPIFNDGWRVRGVGITAGGWHKWVGVSGNRSWMLEGRMHPGIRELAVQEIFRVFEKFSRPNPFSSGLARFAGFRNVDDFMKRWHYGRGKRPYLPPPPAAAVQRMLRIPEYIGKRASRGCRTALKVLDSYAAFSAESVGAVARRLEMSRERFDVVLSGSINAGIPALQRAIALKVRKLAPRARVIPAQFKPVRGALVYAAHQAWGGLPEHSLADQVLRYGDPR
jgi:N-acetylglucosamine kinase-like BadF-type ATPase